MTGFSFTVDGQSTQTEMDTRRSRVRRTSLAPATFINLQWAFEGDQFLTFEDFFKEDLHQGEESFIICYREPTSVENVFRSVEAEVAFVDSEPYLFEEDDSTFSVKAVLEIIELISDEMITV